MRISLFCLLLSAVSCFPKSSVISIVNKHRSDATHAQLQKFDDFVKHHGKNYVSEKETLKRFDIFAKNLKTIERLNSEAKNLTTYDVNAFTDMTFQEFKKNRLMTEKPITKGLLTPMAQRNFTKPKQFDHPENWDWRRSNIVTPVKDQGGCGSCWAFAAVGVIEAMAAKQGKGKNSYSEQKLVDCVPNGCNGGGLDKALGFAKDHGLPSSGDYPYHASNGNCHDAHVAIKIAQFVEVPKDDEKIAWSVTDGGPAATGFQVGESFQHYKNGIANNNDCHDDSGWHAALVVGYGVENGNKFWIVKNSWGSRWGDGGYFKAKRGGWCNFGTGTFAGWV